MTSERQTQTAASRVRPLSTNTSDLASDLSTHTVRRRKSDTDLKGSVRHVRLRLTTGWQPITHNPRTLIVTCSECRVGMVNETNLMRRHGWRESSVGRHRRYLCGDCAAVTA
jgi:hypothetical protein